eukprot:Hpha_TRINITY_DN23746_c0_g1::TRINITY_DN23746_c0_g1_i1::g.93225::m.93225
MSDSDSTPVRPVRRRVGDDLGTETTSHGEARATSPPTSPTPSSSAPTPREARVQSALNFDTPSPPAPAVRAAPEVVNFDDESTQGSFALAQESGLSTGLADTPAAGQSTRARKRQGSGAVRSRRSSQATPGAAPLATPPPAPAISPPAPRPTQPAVRSPASAGDAARSFLQRMPPAVSSFAAERMAERVYIPLRRRCLARLRRAALSRAALRLERRVHEDVRRGCVLKWMRTVAAASAACELRSALREEKAARRRDAAVFEAELERARSVSDSPSTVPPAAVAASAAGRAALVPPGVVLQPDAFDGQAGAAWVMGPAAVRARLLADTGAAVPEGSAAGWQEIVDAHKAFVQQEAAREASSALSTRDWVSPGLVEDRPVEDLCVSGMFGRGFAPEPEVSVPRPTGRMQLTSAGLPHRQRADGGESSLCVRRVGE